MSSEPTPTRRPIAAVRVSTVALIGVVAAIAVPAGAAALVISGSIDSHQRQLDLSQAGPVTKVVIEDSGSSVRVTGDAALSGVSGHADVTWNAFSGDSKATVTEQFADGVLTLGKNCGSGDCGADIDLKVPPTISVRVVTSNAGISVTNVSGGVDLHSSNGGITADRLGGGDAKMETSDAQIRATFAGAPKNIWATTSNAGVSITTDGHTLYYDDVQTTNGEPFLSNPQDHRSDYTVYVRSTNHNVTVR